MPEAPTDFELLTRWGNGDREAGSELFERHFDALLRFFQNKVHESVEDLVQQTLLACVEGRARFRRESNFRTYLFQIARFQLYSHYRKRSRRPEIDFEVTSVADFGTSPTGLIAKKQEQRWLLEALRRIPIQYQLVIELSLWEDLTGPEMAQILEIPEATLRSRLRLAAERLRKQLRDVSGCDHDLGEPGEDFQAWALQIRALLSREATSEE